MTACCTRRRNLVAVSWRFAAENPEKHNLMILNAAIYWTRVVRNIVFVELQLTLVYRLRQKRLRLAPFSWSIKRMSPVWSFHFDITTLRDWATQCAQKTTDMAHARSRATSDSIKAPESYFPSTKRAKAPTL
jgi:hypothetical protein